MFVFEDMVQKLNAALMTNERFIYISKSSRLCLNFLQIMMEKGYIQSYTVIDNKRSNALCVELNGRLNKCAVVCPRFDIKLKEIDKWRAKYMPTGLFGHFILSTSRGLLDHNEAKAETTGGKLLGYFY